MFESLQAQSLESVQVVSSDDSFFKTLGANLIYSTNMGCFILGSERNT